MKENRVRISTAATMIIALSLAWSGIAYAKPPKGPHGDDMRGGKSPIMVIERHAQELGIGEDTLEEIWEVADGIQQEIRKIRRNIRGLKGELKAQLENEQPERTTVMTLLDQIGALQTDAKKLEMGVLLDIRPLLTVEQREALKKFKKRHRRGKK